MGKPLDTDLRRRVVAAIEDGMSTGAAAERFAVSKAAAGAWARLKRATGDVLPKPQGSGFGSVLDPYTDFIDRLIAADKDITLAEIAEQLGETHGLHVVPSTIWYFLDRRGITYKKCMVRPVIARDIGYRLTKNSLHKCIRPLASGLLLQPGHDEIRARRFQINTRAGSPVFYTGFTPCRSTVSSSSSRASQSVGAIDLS
jgi:transposase